MNLMIIEDEIRILNSLANNIPWNQHGIEVVAIAENGKEALAIMERRKPDIVLLDIEMPEMDGITLAAKVLKEEPHIKIVILSGHDDFHYAQQAVELGVMKYLLKPAGEEEILKAVLAAAEEIRLELSERHSLAELQRKWRMRLPQLQEEFYQNWITKRYADWEWHKYANELNLQISNEGRFVVCVCEIDPLSEDESRFSMKDIPLLQFSLKSIATEFFQEEVCRVFNDTSGSTVLLFLGQRDEADNDLTKRVNVLVSRLLNVVKECLKVTASAGMGKSCGLEGVPSSYEQACRALYERTIYGHDIIIPYFEVKQDSRPVVFDSTFEKQLEIALYADDPNRVIALLKQYFENAFSEAASSELIYEHLLYFSSVFTRVIQSNGWSMQQVLGMDYAHFLSLDTLLSKQQILEWAKRVAEHITAYVKNERSNSSHVLVKEVLEIVDQTLDGDLSLHSLAERLYVSPSYLSRLFKKETGEAYTNYVMSRRMERAKELLQGDSKVYEAAYAVGYRDISYFAKVFRKYWGIAPSEIKK